MKKGLLVFSLLTAFLLTSCQIKNVNDKDLNVIDNSESITIDSNNSNQPQYGAIKNDENTPKNNKGNETSNSDEPKESVSNNSSQVAAPTKDVYTNLNATANPISVVKRIDNIDLTYTKGDAQYYLDYMKKNDSFTYYYNELLKINSSKDYAGFFKLLYDRCNKFILNTNDIDPDEFNNPFQMVDKIEYANYNLTIGDAEDVMLFLKRKLPQFYWIEEKYILSDRLDIDNDMDDIIYLTINEDYFKYSSRQNCNEYIIQGLESYRKIVEKDKDKLYNLIKLYNKCQDNIVYINDYEQERYTLLGAIDGQCVCNGQSKLLTWILNDIGVQCISIYSEVHIWNYFNINNNWYGADLTWDDMDILKNGKTYYNYQWFGRINANFDVEVRYTEYTYIDYYTKEQVTVQGKIYNHENEYDLIPYPNTASCDLDISNYIS